MCHYCQAMGSDFTILEKHVLSTDDLEVVLTNEFASVEGIESIERSGEDTLLLTWGDQTESIFLLTNLHLEINEMTSRDDRRALVERYVSSTIGLKNVAPEDKASSILPKILPVIRHKDFLGVKGVLDRGVDVSQVKGPVGERLAGNYAKLIAINGEPIIFFLSYGDLEKIGLTAEAAFDRAVKNLHEYIIEKPLTAEISNGVGFFTLDNNYEASVIYMSDFWDEQAAQMAGDPVLVAPSRDVVMYADSANRVALDRMLELARKNIDTLHHPISADPIVWRDGSWRPYTDQPKSKR